MYYLIRRYPSYICRLQNDAVGGPPDQIFHSLNMSWQNTLRVLADNKELIPEFYTDCSFLINAAHCDLGTDHLGVKVYDVELPPWATTVREFQLRMRKALEEAELAPWIDLVFGVNQRGAKAQQCLNLYQGSVYCEQNPKMMSGQAKEAYFERLRWFGVAPKQLFTERHACRPTQQDNTEASLIAQLKQMQLQLDTALDERVQEYTNLEKYFSKKLQRTKEEGKMHIEEFKQRVNNYTVKVPVFSPAKEGQTPTAPLQVKPESLVKVEEPQQRKSQTEQWNDQTMKLKMLKSKTKTFI